MSKIKNVILSKRLKMVADMVKPGGIVADVGCDHAHTAIYLVLSGRAKGAIAMDLRPGPLAHAKENIKLYGCEDTISTRLCDGISELRAGEADTILISGMGGELIMDILGKNPDAVMAASQLVLSPQSYIEDVRRFLSGRGISIIAEDMCFEDGKYYNVINAVPGYGMKEESDIYLDEELCFMFGECLLRDKNQVQKKQLLFEQGKAKRVIEQLRTDAKGDVSEKLKEFESRLKAIGKALEVYERV